MIALPPALLLTSMAAAVLAGFVCSTVGIFVVRMNLSSIGYCMSHAAFAGAAFGIMAAIDPLVGAVAFSLGTALLIGPLGEKARLESNVIIGFLFSATIALAFIFLSMIPGQAASGTALRILWGSIFAVTHEMVLLLALLAAALTAFTVLFYKEIVAVLFNRKLAEAAGVNTTVFYFAILFFTAAAVSLSLRLVGGLLVFALIVNPTSTAYQFFYDFKKIVVASSLIGIVSCIAGFVLSLFTDFPIGASIVVVSAGGFAASIALSPKRRRGGTASGKKGL